MTSAYQSPRLVWLGVVVPLSTLPFPVHESRVFGDSACVVARHACMNTLHLAEMRRERRERSSKQHPQSFAPSWVRQTKRAR